MFVLVVTGVARNWPACPLVHQSVVQLVDTLQNWHPTEKLCVLWTTSRSTIITLTPQASSPIPRDFQAFSTLLTSPPTPHKDLCSSLRHTLLASSASYANVLVVWGPDLQHSSTTGDLSLLPFPMRVHCLSLRGGVTMTSVDTNGTVSTSADDDCWRLISRVTAGRSEELLHADDCPRAMEEIAHTQWRPYSGHLALGHLSSPIKLLPDPVLSLFPVVSSGGNSFPLKFPTVLSIIGFVQTRVIPSPQSVSSHFIIPSPLPSSKSKRSRKHRHHHRRHEEEESEDEDEESDGSSDEDDDDEDEDEEDVDDGDEIPPSALCAMLARGVGNDRTAAVVSLGDKWRGLVTWSWTNKALVLAALHPSLSPVPGIPPLNETITQSSLVTTVSTTPTLLSSILGASASTFQQSAVNPLWTADCVNKAWKRLIDLVQQLPATKKEVEQECQLFLQAIKVHHCPTLYHSLVRFITQCHVDAQAQNHPGQTALAHLCDFLAGHDEAISHTTRVPHQIVHSSSFK